MYDDYLGPWHYDADDLTVTVDHRRLGPKCEYYVADIMLSGTEIYTGWGHGKAPGWPEMPNMTARRYGAVLSLTGDFLRHGDNLKGVMIRDGKTYYNARNADVLAVMPSGEFEVYIKGTVKASELEALGVRDALAFGPVMVKDGKPVDRLAYMPLGGSNLRTCIGKVEDGHYIAIASVHGISFPRMAQVFLDLGCEWAYNLDGGHSTAMVFMGEQLNRHYIFEESLQVYQRPIPDYLMFGKSELVPEIGDKVKYPVK